MADVNSPDSIEGDAAERIALEAAIAAARTDTRPAVAHEIIRARLLEDAQRARRRISDLANRHLRAG